MARDAFDVLPKIEFTMYVDPTIVIRLEGIEGDVATLRVFLAAADQAEPRDIELQVGSAWTASMRFEGHS